MKKNIIPKDKFDFESAENLKKYSIEDITEELPYLLEWLQDANWPVFEPVRDYLAPHYNFFGDQIVEILKSNDGMWKYWILNCVVKHSGVKPNPDVLTAIINVAQYPTRDDIECEAAEVAQEIVENYC